ERFQQADADRSRQHGLEFVTAEPSDLPVIAHHGFEALRDLAKKRIADRVTERVVDVLEPIEIDHEKRAALLAMGCIAKGLFERLPHHRPVGQASKRIEPREAADLPLRPALLGEVGSDAAKAEEAAALIEDRVAGQ